MDTSSGTARLPCDERESLWATNRNSARNKRGTEPVSYLILGSLISAATVRNLSGRAVDGGCTAVGLAYCLWRLIDFVHIPYVVYVAQEVDLSLILGGESSSSSSSRV